MAQWSDFLPHVLPFAPGCPDPVAEFNLREAARDFCARTRVWRTTLAPMTIAPTAGIGPHAMPLPVDTELVRIERATMNGRLIDAVAEDALPVDWQQYPNTVRDCIFTQDALSVMTVPAYETDRTLVLDVTLKPDYQAEDFPTHLASQYMRAIADGALSLILMQPDKPYTNLALAGVKTAEFNDRVSVVANRVRRGSSSFRPRGNARFF